MPDLRSRVVVAASAGALALLATPVVAAGQVPGVDQVVGGVKDTLESVPPAPAPSVPPPPVDLPAPAPAAPAPAPKSQAAPPAPASGGHGQSPPSPAAQDRSSRRSTPTASGGRPDGARVASKSHSSEGASAAPGGSKKDGDGPADRPHDDVVAGADQGDAPPTDVEIASQAVEVPEDASPSTLPFTGLQLVLIAVLGVAAVAAGLGLRRGARGAG